MSLIRRISNLFSRAKVDREIEAELNSHIAMRIEDNIAAGMSAEEARRDALVRFGNRRVMKEQTTGVDAALFLETIWDDVRYSLRQLRKSPGFAVTVILTLALGIGPNTAVFSVMNSVLLRPLSYPQPGRIVQLEKGTASDSSYSASIALFLDWRKQHMVTVLLGAIPVHWIARSDSDATSLAAQIQAAVLSIDQEEPIAEVRTMRDLLSSSLARWRFNMLLVATFAGIALLLAAIGIYGVISYAVTQRTQEIGIRIALGARRASVLWLVLRQASFLLGSGALAGLAGVCILGRVLKGSYTA